MPALSCVLRRVGGMSWRLDIGAGIGPAEVGARARPLTLRSRGPGVGKGNSGPASGAARSGRTPQGERRAHAGGGAATGQRAWEAGQVEEMMPNVLPC